ncbi:MAG: FGGY family carbohydrate kinase, partial [Pirellula sp.]
LPVGKRLLWNLLSLWKEVEIGIGKAVEEHRDRIVSLGVDTWGVDYVLLDRNDDLVGPSYCYRDPRTRGMMDKAFQKITREEIFQETGIQFMEINTLYQLYSMRVENSPILDIADRFLMIPDFFHWMLTGEKVNEFTNASTTQMLQPGGGGWSSKILDRLSIPEKLFRTPVQPGCSLGSVRPQLRNLTGLSQRAK